MEATPSACRVEPGGLGRVEVLKSKYWLVSSHFLQFYFYLINIDLAALGLSCSIRTLSLSIWCLVPWPRIKPRDPALGAWSLSHWTTKNVPLSVVLNVSLLESNQVRYWLSRTRFPFFWTGSSSSCPVHWVLGLVWHIAGCSCPHHRLQSQQKQIMSAVEGKNHLLMPSLSRCLNAPVRQAVQIWLDRPTEMKGLAKGLSADKWPTLNFLKLIILIGG